MRSNHTHFFLILLLSFTSNSLIAQEGTSSMSMSIGRAGVASRSYHGRFVMPTPDMFRIEEMINYHRHDIVIPEGDQKVALSGKAFRLRSGKSVVQFGLATPRELGSNNIAPLNLVLVIDQSGSMSGPRINKVKEALRELTERLRETDQVTIVGFSGTARVLMRASDKSNLERINRTIDRIPTGGGTNLHAGLMLGYESALNNFNAERTNRVILLTDGRTNQGVTNLETITQDSKAYNKKGIELSTIGLGNDLNHDLLRELAEAGRGLIHFVSNQDDIQKTFVTEVESLLAPAARKVKLLVDFGKSADEVKFFGYSPNREGSRFLFKLDDLNHGATQVIMARIPKSAPSSISATLRYKDAITSEFVEQEITVSLRGNKAQADQDVQRNYAISLVADSIKRAASLSNEGENEKAAKRLRKGQKAATRLMGDRQNKDVNRILEIASGYEENILASLSRNRD